MAAAAKIRQTIARLEVLQGGNPLGLDPGNLTVGVVDLLDCRRRRDHCKVPWARRLRPGKASAASAFGATTAVL